MTLVPITDPKRQTVLHSTNTALNRTRMSWFMKQILIPTSLGRRELPRRLLQLTLTKSLVEKSTVTLFGGEMPYV